METPGSGEHHPSLSKARGANGFSLVEVIIVVGILSVVMMGFMQLTVSGQDDIANLQSKMGQLVLAQDIRFQTSQSSLCMPSLISKAYNGGTAPMDFELDLGGGRVVKAGADLNPTDNLVVKRFQLMNPTTVTTVTQLPGSTVTTTGGTVVSGNLELVTAGGRGSKKELKRMNIGRINLLVDNSANIVDCNSVDLSEANSNNNNNNNQNNNGTSECVAYSAGLPGGTPPWVGDWPTYRDTACSTFTYPMTKAQSAQICSKTTNIWKGTRTPTKCGTQWGQTVLTSPNYSIGPFPAYSSLEECKKAVISDGLQFQTNDGSGGSTTNVCVGGKMISFITLGPSDPYTPPPQTPGDGT